MAALLLGLVLLGPFTACGSAGVEETPTFESHVLGNSSAPRMSSGFYVVSTSEEFASTGASAVLEVAPNFTKTRLAVLAPELSSGSAHLELLAVLPGEDEYVVQYRIQMPEVGTADMAFALILVELPVDARAVRFERQDGV